MTYIAFIFCCLAIVGLITFIIFFICYLMNKSDAVLKTIDPKIVKIIVEIIQIASGFLAFYFSKYDYTLFSCSLSFLIWKCFQLFVDYAHQKSQDNLKISTEKLKQEALVRSDLLSTFRESINDKINSIQKYLNKSSKKNTKKTNSLIVNWLRDHLVPEDDLDVFVVSICKIVYNKIENDYQVSKNVRVGLYFNENGVMTPKTAFDYRSQSDPKFQSHVQYKQAFTVDANGEKAQVVRSIQAKRTLIVEDCVASQSKDNQSFQFYRPGQREYLRSIITYYMGNLYDDKGVLIEACLSIDTELPNYFKESDKDSWELIFQEFAVRLRFERTLGFLLKAQPKGVGNVPDPATSQTEPAEGTPNKKKDQES